LVRTTTGTGVGFDFNLASPTKIDNRLLRNNQSGYSKNDAEQGA